MSSITEMSPEEIQDILDGLSAEAKVAGASLDRIARTIEPGLWKMFPVRTGFGGELFLARIQGDPVMGSGKYIATEDGGAALLAAWHEGPQTGTDVYVEVWDPFNRRSFHGYVDSESRKLVQAG